MHESNQALMVKVWIGLLVLTAVEVVLAYVQLGQGMTLTLLMGFSLVKAWMILGYFMHLKFDRPALAWMLLPPFIACVVVLLAYMLPDGFRAGGV